MKLEDYLGWYDPATQTVMMRGCLYKRINKSRARREFNNGKFVIFCPATDLPYDYVGGLDSTDIYEARDRARLDGIDCTKEQLFDYVYWDCVDHLCKWSGTKRVHYYIKA